MNLKQQSPMIFILSMSLVILGCGSGQVLVPTMTSTLTKTQTLTATNRPTKTSTSTPTPTATLPINVPMPLEGKGIVFGQIRKGALLGSNMPVQLCSEYVSSIYGVCGSGKKYKVIADNEGFFIFDKVEPGRYKVLVVLLPDSRVIYWKINVDIKAGETQNWGVFDME